MSQPIPDPIWRRLVEFLADGRTGRIVLNVRVGKILDAEFPPQPDRVFAADVLDSPR